MAGETKTGLNSKLYNSQGRMDSYRKDYIYTAYIKSLSNMCNPTFHVRWKDTSSPVLAYTFIDNVQNQWIKAQLQIWSMKREEYKLDHKLQIIQ